MASTVVCNVSFFVVAPTTVKPVLSSNSKRGAKIGFKTDYRLMRVKSIAECSREHSAILSTFIKLPFVIKTFALSVFVYFEWPFKTCFTAYVSWFWF